MSAHPPAYASKHLIFPQRQIGHPSPLSGANKQPVSLPDFYMDKTEVSNANYAKYFEARGRHFKELVAARKDSHDG